MIYKLVSSIVVLNLIYEIIEIIFPAKKMKNTIKSFILILIFYEICKVIIDF